MKKLNLLQVSFVSQLLIQRCFQNERNVSEVGRVHYPPESLHSDAAAANLLMPVTMAASGTLAVIKVTSNQSLPSHHRFKILHEFIKAILR